MASAAGKQASAEQGLAVQTSGKRCKAWSDFVIQTEQCREVEVGFSIKWVSRLELAKRVLEVGE